MPKKRSEAARARQRARSRAFAQNAMDARESRDTRAMMRPDGLQPGAGSIYDPSRVIAERHAGDGTTARGYSRQGVTYRGAPRLADTRSSFPTGSRARDLVVRDKDGNVTYDSRNPVRKPRDHDAAARVCQCAGCIADRRIAREQAELARRQNEAQATGRGWA